MNPFSTIENREVWRSPASRIQQFLNLLNSFTENLGMNVPQIVNFEKLHSLKTETFGRAWVDFLEENELKPLTSGSRRQQLYHGIHILTGYGIDVVGQAELQAFLLGAKFRPANLLLLLRLLQIISENYGEIYPHISDRYAYQECQNLQKRLWKAYQRGRYSLLDPDKWEPELLWNFPLVEVRTLFRV